MRLNIKRLLLPAAALVLLSACTKEEPKTLSNDVLFEGTPENVSFEASMTLPDGLQKSYIAGDSVVWEDGDEIRVNNQVFTVHTTNQGGQKVKGTAFFWGTATPMYSAWENNSGNADTVKNWFAVYPKDLAASTTTLLKKNGSYYTKEIHVKFPQVQTYQEVDERNGKFLKNMNYMVAYATERMENKAVRLQFVNLCAVLKVGFTAGRTQTFLDGSTNNAGIRKIVLVTSTSEKTAFNGEGYINSADNTGLSKATSDLNALPNIQIQIDNANNRNRKLVLDCGGMNANPTSVSLSTTTKWFYIMVPINMMDGLNDLCMEVYDNEGNMMRKCLKGQSIVKRNKMYTVNMGALACQYAASSFIDADVSIDATHSMKLSSGNLQYNPKDAIWRFAANQWDTVGKTDNEKIVNGANCNVFIDLFGYGTSGYNGKYGYLHTNVESDYPSGNISKSDYDWGKNNMIISGTNTTGHAKGAFYTWTYNQAAYMLNDRTTGSTLNGVDNARFAAANVNGINGVLIFPDEYTHPTGVALPNKNSINQNDGLKYSANTYTAADMAKMEKAGVAFLPSAGIRGYGNDYYKYPYTDASHIVLPSDTWGCYWTSTETTNINPPYAGYLLMKEEQDATNVGTYMTYVNTGGWWRYGGRSVRLILGNF